MQRIAKPGREVAVYPRSVSPLRDRALLAVEAARMLGRPSGSVPVSQHCPDCGRDHGQPTVEGGGAWVSLSRAGGFVAVAVSVIGPIGIDIVSTRAVEAHPLDAVRFDRGIGSAAQSWAFREAVLKADGRGLRCDPEEIVLSGSPGGALVDAWPEARVALASIQLTSFSVDEDVVGAFAVFDLGPEPRQRSTGSGFA